MALVQWCSGLLIFLWGLREVSLVKLLSDIPVRYQYHLGSKKIFDTISVLESDFSG